MTIKPDHILTDNYLGLSETYFNETVLPALEATRAHTEARSTTYHIAGRRVCIIAYGDAVHTQLSRALAHHAVLLDTAPDLTIIAWDDQTTGSELTAPWDDPSFTKVPAAASDSFFGVYVGGEESLNFYDRSTHTGYFWTHDATQLPDWALGAPFRTILHWFFNDEHIHLIHGAVVGTEDRALLLTARSGSGKSTTALSAILAGMQYLGDDYVAIEPTNPVQAHSLYQTAKVTPAGLTLFPELVPHVANAGFSPHEKAVMFLNEVFPEQVRTSATLTSICIPRIGPGPTRLTRARKIDAMLAIAPTTLLQLPLAETSKLGAFKNILDHLPCYYLELGPEVREVPRILEQQLRHDAHA